MPGSRDAPVTVALPHPVDPAAAAAVLAATGGAWFWLDGAEPAAGEPRESLLGTADEVREARPGREREFLAGLRSGAPYRWIAALGYEFGVALLDADAPSGAPVGGVARDDAAPGFALRADAVLAIDHVTGRAEVRGESAAVAAWIARHGAGIAAAAPAAPPLPEPAALVARPAWRRSDARYAADVAACRAAIRDGDAYVLCLTDTAEGRTRRRPLELYLRLRAAGAATRGAVIAIPTGAAGPGSAARALVSASPERFLAVRGRDVRTHPIKGTRPRDPEPAADAALARELARHPKERAENLMIVDLMRNDLSRVCAPGTVGVEGFLRVETHAHVHQLVSTVAGRLRGSAAGAPGADAIDALAACFPGGSMTGAPKRRAVELLAGIEGAPRGLYAGCFGWLGRGPDGALDAELAMTIRGIELRGDPERPEGARALVGAGGGITADSDAAYETAEKRLKARAILAALDEGAGSGAGGADPGLLGEPGPTR